MKTKLSFLASLVLPLAAGVVVACSSVPATTDTETAVGPDPGAFAASVGGVYGVFARRCGSIDCHGNQYRAMRIYGKDGIRIPNEAGIAVGGADPTPEEISATYHSIVSVEPEQMTSVVKSKGDPYSLLILKKPLQIESHKGGPAIFKGDDSETCIVSWVGGTANKAACTSGAALP